MQKNPIGWVEVPVSDIERAEKFYTEYFSYEMTRQPEKNGWQLSWFPMDEGYGAAGMLIQGSEYTPSHEGPVVYFTAPEGSITKALEKAETQGVTVLVPKTSAGEHGWFAWIEDCEGNRIAIHSMVE